MLKGPKRSFVVVVVVIVIGVVETCVKNAPNGTKYVRVQNLLQIEQKEQKMFANENRGLLWPFMFLYVLVWAFMAFSGPLWQNMGLI